MPISMFENIVQLQGSAKDVEKAQKVLNDARDGIADAVPVARAVYTVLNLLPEGDLKKWLTANPIQFWKKVIELFKGRKYTSGDYVLGERYHDNIICKGDAGRRDIPDEMVPVAWQIFTILFGVRIRTSDDLDSLDRGVSAYYSRGAHTQDADRDAVERAVYLKQHYYPSSTYNRVCWDLKYFEQFPLVAPIPDPNQIGGLYTGPIPGGGNAVNGVIPLDAQTVLKQLPPDSPFDPNQQQQPPATNTGPSNFLEKLTVLVKANPGTSLLVAAAAIYVAYQYYDE